MNTTETPKATLRIVNVMDLGTCSGTCQRCGRGIRYSALMTSGETYGLDCAASATLGRKLRATASSYRNLKCELDYERRMAWEAADPRNAAFAATFLEYVHFWELRDYRDSFYEASLTDGQMKAALEVIAGL